MSFFWLTTYLCYSIGVSALENEDFRPVQIDLIFNEETSNIQIVSVPILNDRCLEEDGEDFSVLVRSEMDCVEITDGQVTVLIDDDDSELSL